MTDEMRKIISLIDFRILFYEREFERIKEPVGELSVQEYKLFLLGCLDGLTIAKKILNPEEATEKIFWRFSSLNIYMMQENGFIKVFTMPGNF